MNIMKFNNINVLKDSRVNGYSISTVVTITEYLDWFVEYGLPNKLEDQRPVMKTRSANMIRKRLVDDLQQGAVIPPIVLGFTDDNIKGDLKSDIIEEILNNHISQATVIDGMQRSEALRLASEENAAIGDNPLRLEIWITPNAISLIYRMLVLNTGQTPWDVKRQMEVVYKPLVEECEHAVQGIVINRKNDNARRRNGGEYTANSIVELFLAFSSKKEIINTADKLADDFTRLDVTKMTSSPERSNIFYKCMNMLYLFDKAISKYDGANDEKIEGDKICSGMDLFTQMPAKIGFIVALAQSILGRTGTDKPIKEQDENLKRILDDFKVFCTKIETMNNDELGEFLSFGMLNDVLKGLSIKKIGDEQRRFFTVGFEALVRNGFTSDTMELDWRAY